jgi:hypothetical protein
VSHIFNCRGEGVNTIERSIVSWFGIRDSEASGRSRNATRESRDKLTFIVGASAKAGIKGLVYALARYNPTTEEVIAAFKIYVQEEAKKYEPEFPNELYEQWHRLYEIPVPDRGKPWQFKHLTVKHIHLIHVRFARP